MFVSKGNRSSSLSAGFTSESSVGGPPATVSLSSVRFGATVERGVRGMVDDSVVEPDAMLADEMLGCDGSSKLSYVFSGGVELACVASLLASALELTVSDYEATMEPIVVKLSA